MDSFKEWVELDEGFFGKYLATPALIGAGLLGGFAGHQIANRGERPADNPQAFIQKSKELGMPNFVDVDNKEKQDFRHDSHTDFYNTFAKGIAPRNDQEKAKLATFYNFWYEDRSAASFQGQMGRLIQTLPIHDKSKAEISKKIFQKNFSSERMPRMSLAGKDPTNAASYNPLNRTVTMNQARNDYYATLGHELQHARHGLSGMEGWLTDNKTTEIMSTVYNVMHELELAQQLINTQYADYPETREKALNKLNNFEIRLPSGFKLRLGYLLENGRSAGWMNKNGYSRYMASKPGIQFFRQLIYGR